MINVPFKEINAAAIEALVANQIPEGRTLDYKDKLPGWGKEDRKEFLADVSALANAVGGDIIYGVSERRENGKPTGMPESVSGLGSITLDAELLRLENIIRDGIEPRIIGLQVTAVEGCPAGPVIVIRVLKSHVGPHMIKAGDSRFYSRNSRGKYPLDVSEIRSAFALSESLPEKVRRFRDERISRIVADDTPVPLPANRKSVLHVLPISALDPTNRVDVASLFHRTSEFPPMSECQLGGWAPRHNLEGLLIVGNPPNSSTSTSYVQLYRSGAIEAVESVTFNRPDNCGPFIPSAPFESTLILALDRFKKLLMQLSVDPPIFVMPSLIGVKDYRLAMPSSAVSDEFGPYPVDRDTLLLPEGLVHSFDEPADKLLQPALDALWQCVGYDRDRLFQDQGNGRWLDRPGKKPIV
jgi:hypothetical protein